MSQLDLQEAWGTMDPSGSPNEAIVLGCADEIMSDRLVEPLLKFSTLIPQGRLEVFAGDTEQLREEVAGGHLDGAFVCGPVAHPLLSVDTIGIEPMAVIMPRSMRVNELSEMDQVRGLVMRSSAFHQVLLESYMRRRFGTTNCKTAEYGSWDAILTSVALATGISIAPRVLVAQNRHRDKIVCLDESEMPVSYEVAFIRRKMSERGVELSLLADLFRKVPHKRPDELLMAYGQDH